jgi:sugar phosphate isomerase/epimerase
MPQSFVAVNRRVFGLASLAAAGAAAAPTWLSAAAAQTADAAQGPNYCAFIKFLRSMKYDELAEAIAAAGFDGVEATVRTKDGYIKPANAAVELPKFKSALDKQGLEITILTTDILKADQEHAESVLAAAAEVGVPRYRLGFWRYDLKTPLDGQLAQLQSEAAKLAALNRKLGIAAVYQNHCGPDMVGALLWDLHALLKDHPPSELGVVWDQRHATVEAGEAWPQAYALMKPHITAYSVKDFKWNGRKSAHVPLGEGQVAPEFYKRLAESGWSGPISVHVEYEDDAKANLAAIKRDFAVLKGWMKDV